MAESKAKLIARAAGLVELLKKTYPGAKCSLDFKTPHQLLVATILSAQCTDERVNKVTPGLFEKYRNPEDFAKVSQEELENDIRSTGFFRNKAKAIREASRKIMGQHEGKIPERMEDLTELPGVGRKTASVVLGTAFGKAEGIVVDTHVARLSQRLGLTRNREPLKIEQDLMKIIDKSNWIILSHLLIDHGRAICRARKPDCKNCVLSPDCPSTGKIKQ